MAQQNTSFAVYGTLAFFMVLSGVLGTWAGIQHSTASQLDSELHKARKDKTESDAAVRKGTDQIATLKSLIGHEGEDNVGAVGDQDPNSIAGKVTQKFQSPRVTDGTAAAENLDQALDKAVGDRDTYKSESNQRQQDLQQKINDLDNERAAKQKEIDSVAEARDKAEAELSKARGEYEEKVFSINEQFKQTNQELNDLRNEFANYKDRVNRQITVLELDNSDKRRAILTLRKELFEQRDVSFAKADGKITSTDQGQLLAYINLGRIDGLKEGTTFSVYTSDNGGVGRQNTDDIKGQVEVVEIMAPHLAKVSITNQDLGRPVGKGDPIYSPVFTSGVPMQLAIAGLIEFNGSPGSDRDELLQMIKAQGARVPVQVGDDGNFVAENGEVMSDEEARNSISQATRFLIIGDLGFDANEDDARDERRLETYRAIQRSTAQLQKAAENHGVFEVGLSTFLEYMGYRRKNLMFRTGNAYPRHLANGARSPRVGSTFGNRASSAAISGAFSNRKVHRVPSQFPVSKLYQ